MFKLVKKIDLKSIGCNGLVGSSPATHTKEARRIDTKRGKLVSPYGIVP